VFLEHNAKGDQKVDGHKIMLTGVSKASWRSYDRALGDACTVHSDGFRYKLNKL